MEPPTEAQQFQIIPFHMGRPPSRLRFSLPVYSRTSYSYSPSSSRPPFPLSQMNSRYSFMVHMALGEFPSSSVAAILHLKQRMAPLKITSDTPELFQWKSEQLQLISNAFHENLRARWGFRRLYRIYLTKKMKYVNENTDPITLEPIQKKVSIYILKTHSIYEFEAKSIAKTWITNLLHNDGLFHEPRYPTNPLTNLPLNVLQIHKGIQEIRAANQTNWVLETFSKCHYDLDLWCKIYAIQLRLECLDRVFSDSDNYDRNDLLFDFIELQHGPGINTYFYSWLLSSTAPVAKEHVEKWAKECKKYYVQKYVLVDKTEYVKLELKTRMATRYLFDIPDDIHELYLVYCNKYYKSMPRIQHMHRMPLPAPPPAPAPTPAPAPPPFERIIRRRIEN